MKNKNPFHIDIVSPRLINMLTFNDKKVRAMAFYPFILYRHKNYADIKVIENHELIHHQQQRELLIIPFHLLYFLHFLYGLIKLKNYNKAYYHVCFEQEAYAHENDFEYLKNRKFGSWRKYVFRD